MNCTDCKYFKARDNNLKVGYCYRYPPEKGNLKKVDDTMQPCGEYVSVQEQ